MSLTTIGDAVFAWRQSFRHELAGALGRHSIAPTADPVAAPGPQAATGHARRTRARRCGQSRRRPAASLLPPAIDAHADSDPARRRAEPRRHRTRDRFGIPDSARIVTLHVREPGYKRGMEVQDKADARATTHIAMRRSKPTPGDRLAGGRGLSGRPDRRPDDDADPAGRCGRSCDSGRIADRCARGRSLMRSAFSSVCESGRWS